MGDFLHLTTIAIAFFAAFLMCWVMVRHQPRVETLIGDRSDADAVQSSHIGKPLRLGGVAILFGLLASGVTLIGYAEDYYALWLIFSCAPVFLAGVLEDAGWPVSPGRRFAAAILSAIIAVVVLGHWVMRIDLPVLDGVFAIAAISIPITVVFAAGFCHALNLVDGLNGLAALIILSAALGLALVANSVGLRQVEALSVLLFVATLGFAGFNWPKGRLFLGDAGAYVLGHLLVWLAISISFQAEGVAIPALLLILFWPLGDTLHTITRRVLKKTPVFHPDRMHLHQKVRRAIEILILHRRDKRISNPMATLVLAPFVLAPTICGVLLFDHTEWAWFALVVFVFVFTLTNIVAVAVARKYRSRSRQFKNKRLRLASQST